MKRLEIEVISTNKAKSVNDTVTPRAPQERDADKLRHQQTRCANNLQQYGKSLVKSTAKQTFNYFKNDIGRRTGDTNYQAMVDRSLEIASDGISLAQSAIMGAKMGSALGPAGMLIGGILGTAASGISLGFKYAERERAYQHEMFKENNSQAYNLARANYSALTGRVR